MAKSFFKKARTSKPVSPAPSTQNSQAETIKINLLVLGDSKVGKTALVNRLLHDQALKTGDYTADIQKKILENKLGKIDLSVMDVQGGYSRFEDLGPIFLRLANTVVFVYDQTDKDSFNNISEWMRQVENRVELNQIFALIGTKSDLNKMKAVTTQEALQFAANHQMQFFEVSAESNLNVQESFHTLFSQCQMIEIQERNKKITLAEVKEINDSICLEIQKEMKDFLTRKKANESTMFYTHSDRICDRYNAMKELHQEVQSLATSIIENNLYLTEPDWKKKYQEALENSVNAYLADPRIEKYSPLAKWGIKLLNIISILFSPIKRAITGTWTYSLHGKSKKTLLRVKDKIKKIGPEACLRP